MPNKRQKRYLVSLSFVIFLACLQCSFSYAFRASDFHWTPPLLSATNEMPSVTIVLDSSDSMVRLGHANTEELQGGQYKNYGFIFGNKKPKVVSKDTDGYYGYFKSSQRYNYTNAAGNECFYEDPTGPWSGNFLNWATMHRIDLIRKALTGGTYNATKEWFEVQTRNDQPYIVSFDDTSTNFTPYNSTITISQEENKNTILITYTYTYKDDKGKDQTGTATSAPYFLRIKTNDYSTTNLPSGVLQQFKNKARFALFRFVNQKTNPGNEHAGGELVVRMASGNVDIIVQKINEMILAGQGTPLAETLFSVMGWVQQIAPKKSESQDTTDKNLKYVGIYDVGKNSTSDPFYFDTYGTTVSCTQQNVIMLTGGESTYDQFIPNTIKQEYPDYKTFEKVYTDKDIAIVQSKGSALLNNVAYRAHISDLRDDLDGMQSINLYTVYAFGKASLMLRHSSIYGGFTPKSGKTNSDGDPIPEPDPIKDPTNMKTPFSYDYNTDVPNDYLPDNYFEAEDPSDLERMITIALDLATRNLLSGTAAAVTSQTRSGEGAVYQALFFPPYSTTSVDAIAPSWAGQVHAFHVDSKGNMREDTLKNGNLDLKSDRIVQFQDKLNTININLITDSDGNGVISNEEANASTSTTIDNIKYLWSSSDWLNSASLDPITQRSDSGSNFVTKSNERYIFTSVNGTKQHFVTSSATPDLRDPSKFTAYLTLFPSFDHATLQAKALTDANLLKLANRQIRFIRGEEIGISDITDYPDNARSRTFKGKAWRLGDVIYSSPTVVSAPAEKYDLLYRDETYAKFHKQYRNRRNVIYVGANDGMLHAFNGGFYNGTGFNLSGSNDIDLGTEIWAYIPFNLLSHLRWLMEPAYGEQLHVPYMDLKPRVFDARIFEEDDDHPHGWGTILVAGMRFGGAEIIADINKDHKLDGIGEAKLSSAYVILDITNPEKPPVLLGEINMPNLGFTTCYPTLMPLTQISVHEDSDKNQWYLVFGSGPADSTGKASHKLLNDWMSIRDVPTFSLQKANLYVVDLKKLARTKKIYSLKSSTTTSAEFTEGKHSFFTTNENAFISDPVSVDFDFGSKDISREYKSDVVYYGTVSGNATDPSGKIYRFLTPNDYLPDSLGEVQYWDASSSLININQPITAAPNIATDENKNHWVYFGTGRFFNKGDLQQSPMSFYGIKEPTISIDGQRSHTWDSIDKDDLYDSTNVYLTSTCAGNYAKNCVQINNYDGAGNSTDWDVFASHVAKFPGWYNNFSGWERNLGQAVVLGGTTLFTSYIPSSDICNFEGDSRLYGLYYKTGTPYYDPIFASSNDYFPKFIGLGKGMALTPNVHIGDKGTKGFIQTSSGAIQTIEFNTPISVKSGPIFWKKNTN